MTASDLLSEWITSAYLDRHYTGRFRGLRDAKVVPV